MIKIVTQNVDKVIEEFTETFIGITNEDKETGHIYVLTSQSEKEDIASLENLYKIGYSSTSVQERILLIMLQYQIFRQAIWNSASFLKIILDNLYQDSPKERFKIPVINSDFSIF